MTGAAPNAAVIRVLTDSASRLAGSDVVAVDAKHTVDSDREINWLEAAAKGHPWPRGRGQPGSAQLGVAPP